MARDKTGRSTPFQTAPRFAEDLVNVDFPTEQEYKHYLSLWSSYQHGDFSGKNWVPEYTSKRLAIERQEQANIFWLIFGLLMLFVALAGAVLSIKSYGRGGAFFSLGVGALSVFVALGAILVVVYAAGAQAASKEEHQKFKLNGKDELLKGPVTPRQLLGLLWIPPFGLRKPAFRGGRTPWWVRELGQILFSEITNVRTVWLGNGQLQFGCGPKGLSVEHHGGFLYLIHWHKIEAVYDADDAPPEFEVGEWAKDSLRFRLKRTSEKDPNNDEIIVPKRFFGKEAGQLTWEDFLEHCHDYHDPEHEDAGDHGSAGKGAGTTVIVTQC